MTKAEQLQRGTPGPNRTDDLRFRNPQGNRCNAEQFRGVEPSGGLIRNAQEPEGFQPAELTANLRDLAVDDASENGRERPLSPESWEQPVDVFDLAAAYLRVLARAS